MKETETARKAALAAGAFLKEKFYSGQLNPQLKQDGTWVSEADCEAEKMILRILQDPFPHYGVFAEE